MRALPLIILLCSANQGCSYNANHPANEPMNQQQMNTQSFPSANVETTPLNQTISAGSLIDASQIVDENGTPLTKLKKETESAPERPTTQTPLTEMPNGDIKNMSNKDIIAPEPKSYWM